MSEKKRQKLMEKDENLDPNTSENNVKIGFHELNDDCVLLIFDWLTIKELAIIKMICKRFYSLANEHFKNTYKNQITIISKEHETICVRSQRKYVKSFRFRVPKISCSYAGFESFELIKDQIRSNINSISLRIWGLSYPFALSATHCKYAKYALQNVKMVEFENCSEIHNFMVHCTNVEYLVLHSLKPGEQLFTYRTLKQLRWVSTSRRIPVEFEMFMLRNPSVKILSVEYECHAVTNWLLETAIKLEDLVLTVRMLCREDEKNIHVDRFIENLYSLHRNQKIKRLHLDIHALTFLSHAKLPEMEFLESVCVYICDPDRKTIDLVSRMSNLKFLLYSNRYHITDRRIEVLAQKLTKLEEFHMSMVNSIDDIMPFVRHSPKLGVFYVKCYSWDFPREIRTTLQMLDKERSKLKDACKLTIYVDEDNYLKIKLNSSTSSYGLVEIKRDDSYPFSNHPIRPNVHR